MTKGQLKDDSVQRYILFSSATKSFFCIADVPNTVAAAIEELDLAVELEHVDRHQSF